MLASPSGLPFAGFGALLTSLVFRQELSVYSYVGLIMLIGVVKKNAIMMTTICALFGTLPIALGLGAGAESRRPLGLAVVGGLAFSQFITLYVTPVRAAKMVKDWAKKYNKDLMEMWKSQKYRQLPGLEYNRR